MIDTVPIWFAISAPIAFTAIWLFLEWRANRTG